ncbi:YciI family protein [Algiphilus sp.]|uniref:YciI family protein n=1 Tax=Algiphilus sp. TaxID=1872431 RepID=UPI0025B922E9|nr:YciI family protein [Algiphilus sp.]MCK5770707.1 YciI family protein [Algiphilus sp.]
MKYLCLVYAAESALQTQSDSPRDGECAANDEALKASGHFLLGQALQPVSAATTVRMRNGRVSVTDGPFAETKEQLAGFILIEARDLNDAIQVASRIPSARVGSIEIRPTRELMAPTHAAAV